MTAPPSSAPPAVEIAATVTRALAEDVGSGDVTASLVDAAAAVSGRVRCKEPAVLCGTAWFDEVYRQVDGAIAVTWHFADGDEIAAGAAVCTLAGPARGILTGERTALNFLQTLSGTATVAHRFAAAVAGTATKVLDTRKTLPGLRRAQKYAVRCGGAENHRQGLYDAVLIKENHIAAAGGITAAVERAVAAADGLMIEVEVETLDELREALATPAHRIMLDDFTLDQLREAVAIRDAMEGAAGGSRKALEASGSVDLDTLRALAETGVDYVSIGAMTKNVRAIDFSLRLDD
ncbi:MAG: carboxylating nicotinate-nucleotide diphosphorylase [Gammaproteobacteria bacterium]|nr:carboxylating nicotinate-nucleotide diphosphorylase [Gammaproteobacteria bacterium]